MNMIDETLQRADSPALTALRFATVIPSISLGRELGRGGMAVVYEGLDQGFTPPRQVAVKLMDADMSGDPEFRSRFDREASLVANFRHDNIVHVYSSGEAGGGKYIVMEYLAGGSLAERTARGPLPPADALKIAAALADALAYSHAQGVVHRDFKPGNVLFTANGKPVLSDFGIAKPTLSADESLTKHAMIMGAPRYMAPEQSRGDPVTDRADIYSFGVTLLEMLVGRLPEYGARVLSNADGLTEVRAVLDPISPAVTKLVCSCLLQNPLARPSAAECLRQLSALRAIPELKPRPRVGMLLLGVVIVVACGVAATVLGTWYKAPAPTLAPTPAPTAAPTAASTRSTLLPAVEAQPKAPADVCPTPYSAVTLDATLDAGIKAQVALTLYPADSDQYRQAQITINQTAACLQRLQKAGISSADSRRFLQELDASEATGAQAPSR